MRQIFKKSGFTLIELLVVIVILGILSTISVGTFRGYFAKARDAERLSAVMNIAMMIKVDSGGTGNCGVYNYLFVDANDDDTNDITPAPKTYVGSGTDCGKIGTMDTILMENDYKMPAIKNGLKYFYGFRLGEREGDNDFFIIVGTEGDNPQNAEDLWDDDAFTSGSGYAFVGGTSVGTFVAINCSELKISGVNNGKFWVTSSGTGCNASIIGQDADWTVLEINENGAAVEQP